MASITISELHPTGSELFSDSEGYMDELSYDEFNNVHGGLPFTIWAIGYGIRVSSAKCGKYAASGAIAVSGAVSGWITGGK